MPDGKFRHPGHRYSTALELCRCLGWPCDLLPKRVPVALLPKRFPRVCPSVTDLWWCCRASRSTTSFLASPVALSPCHRHMLSLADSRPVSVPCCLSCCLSCLSVCLFLSLRWRLWSPPNRKHLSWGRTARAPPRTSLSQFDVCCTVVAVLLLSSKKEKRNEFPRGQLPKTNVVNTTGCTRHPEAKKQNRVSQYDARIACKAEENNTMRAQIARKAKENNTMRVQIARKAQENKMTRRDAQPVVQTRSQNRVVR